MNGALERSGGRKEGAGNISNRETQERISALGNVAGEDGWWQEQEPPFQKLPGIQISREGPGSLQISPRYSPTKARYLSRPYRVAPRSSHPATLSLPASSSHKMALWPLLCWQRRLFPRSLPSFADISSLHGFKPPPASAAPSRHCRALPCLSSFLPIAPAAGSRHPALNLSLPSAVRYSTRRGGGRQPSPRLLKAGGKKETSGASKKRRQTAGCPGPQAPSCTIPLLVASPFSRVKAPRHKPSPPTSLHPRFWVGLVPAVPSVWAEQSGLLSPAPSEGDAGSRYRAPCSHPPGWPHVPAPVPTPSFNPRGFGVHGALLPLADPCSIRQDPAAPRSPARLPPG